MASGPTAVTGDRYKWVALSNTTTAVFMSALDPADTCVNMVLVGPIGATTREAHGGRASSYLAPGEQHRAR
jgi:hypothetical protein